jgi:DNA mismatch endonuclease (patch repair protein)
VKGARNGDSLDDRNIRSRIMRSVRQERTKPEEAVARALRKAGVRFRQNVRSLPGSPDVANKSRRFAIYVHGCFWHRHPGCAMATTPKVNAEFWQQKFEANVERDARKAEALRALGYAVTIIWECETRDQVLLELRIAEVIACL